MKLVPKTKGFQSAIPQHQKGIEFGQISDSGIDGISNSALVVHMLEITNNQGLKIIPADNGKGPHATSSSSLPPLGLKKKES